MGLNKQRNAGQCREVERGQVWPRNKKYLAPGVLGCKQLSASQEHWAVGQLRGPRERWAAGRLSGPRER